MDCTSLSALKRRGIILAVIHESRSAGITPCIGSCPVSAFGTEEPTMAGLSGTGGLLTGHRATFTAPFPGFDLASGALCRHFTRQKPARLP